MATFETTESFVSNSVATGSADHTSKRHSLRSASSSCSQHVDFKTEPDNVDVNEVPRQKHLTAKYPKHQMGLIRKRLAVEDWIEAELKKLFDISDDDYETYDTILDLDEVLNFDTDSEKASYVRERLANVPKPEPVLQKFIDELLLKAATL